VDGAQEEIKNRLGDNLGVIETVIICTLAMGFRNLNICYKMYQIVYSKCVQFITINSTSIKKF
jgi:hypothetical protein